MAARRIAKSAVDWAAFKDRVPPKQQDFFRAFKSRNENYVNRVFQYPEEMPKIDFAFYKSKLADPTVVEQFEKAVSRWNKKLDHEFQKDQNLPSSEKNFASISVPYPKDKSNVLQKIDEQQKEAEIVSKRFIAARQEEIKDAKLLLTSIDKLPKPEEMTLEMYAYYFPNLALDPVNRPTFWPHIPMLQPGNKDYHGL